MTFKKQGKGFFISAASSEVPDIERVDLEQALKKAPLFVAIIFSHFCVFLAEQWNHDVIASSKTGILPNWCRGKEMLFVYVVTYPSVDFRCIQSHAIELVTLPFLSLSKNQACFKGVRLVTLLIMNCYVIQQTFASPCSYANKVFDIEQSD